MQKSLSVAYLLWLVGGPLGLYKFYLGRPLVGLCYFFTCGIFFLGWLVDFFTLPRQVRIANLLAQQRDDDAPPLLRREIETLKGVLAHVLDRRTEPAAPAWNEGHSETVKPAPTDDEIMLQLLRAAQKQDGRLSVTAGVMETGVPFAEVERVLKKMLESNYVYMDNDPSTGVIVYVFKEIL